MVDQATPRVLFPRSTSLTWVLGIVAGVLVLIREGTSNPIAFIGFCIGAAALAYIFGLIARYFLRSRITGDIGALHWNVGIIAYVVFFLCMWAALGQ